MPPSAVPQSRWSAAQSARRSRAARSRSLWSGLLWASRIWIGLALRAPRLGPCTQPRTGRFRWRVAASTPPGRRRGPKNVRSAPVEAITNAMNVFRPVPRPRPFRVLPKPCSPQVGEDQQPTSGAHMSAHWTRHRGPTMHQASRGHAGGVSATVGLGVPKVPGGRPVDPTAVPVVPLPLFGLLNLYPLSWTFARLPVPLLFRRERRSALLLAGIAYSSALVSPGSRLPHEAGRLFTRQRSWFAFGRGQQDCQRRLPAATGP